jgi:hypothetical protein
VPSSQEENAPRRERRFRALFARGSQIYRGLFTRGDAVPLPAGVDAPLPGVAGVAGVDGADGGEIVPDAPVAGGVVVAPPAAGVQGTAVPLVPVGAGVESVVAPPLLRAVVLPAPPATDPLLLGLPGVVAPAPSVLPLPDAAAEPESGPVSVALFTRPFADVVVPVELFA